jgi:hypothetical protein
MLATSPSPSTGGGDLADAPNVWPSRAVLILRMARFSAKGQRVALVGSGQPDA